MDIRISSEGINISPKSKLKIQKKIGTKVEKLLAHLSQDLKTGHLRIEKLKYRQYKANFEMLLPGKNGRIVAQNINHQLLTTVTGLREIIERQITKYKNLTFNPKKKTKTTTLN
jgi:ribosomal subunit interface protein